MEKYQIHQMKVLKAANRDEKEQNRTPQKALSLLLFSCKTIWRQIKIIIIIKLLLLCEWNWNLNCSLKFEIESNEKTTSQQGSSRCFSVVWLLSVSEYRTKRNYVSQKPNKSEGKQIFLRALMWMQKLYLIVSHSIWRELF